MAFPTGLTIKTHVVAPLNRAQAARSVLDRLEQAFYDHDAEITNRGDSFFEFTVPVTARIARAVGFGFSRPPWWPLFFIRGGSVSLIDDLGVYRVTAEVHTSVFPIAHLLVPFAIGAWITPVGGVLPRFIGGAVIGLAFSGISYLLARWHFGAWLERTGGEVTDEIASGRLRSA